MKTPLDQDVPALLKALRQSHPVIRRKAIRALGRFGPAAVAALPALRQSLDDLDAGVREEATRTLALVGAAAVPILTEALTNLDRYVRREAVWGLKQLAPAARSALPALLVALRDSDLKVRKGAALALEAIDPEPVLVIPALIQALGDTNVVFCRLVANALAKLGTRAVPALTSALASRDRYIRREAAWALGQVGPEARAAVPALIWALRDGISSPYAPAPERRVGGLAEGATPVVVVEPWKPSDRTFVLSVAEALGRIGPDAVAAVAVLREAARDADDKLRPIAADALLRIEGREPGPIAGRVPAVTEYAHTPLAM